MGFAAWARRELRNSLWLLSVVMLIAVIGLGFEGNWPKVVRIVAAATGYASLLLVLERTRMRADRRVQFWWFAAAGAVAGFSRAQCARSRGSASYRSNPRRIIATGWRALAGAAPSSQQLPVIRRRMHMNLIVGATGFLGSEICQLLRQRGEPVRALVRTTSDAARQAALKGLGAELSTGDLKDAASLRRACEGVRTVITTATIIKGGQEGDTFDAVDAAGQRALIDAARAAGAEHLIYVSVTGNITVPSPLIDSKRAVEQHLVNSGLAYTILRPSAFMEVWLGPLAGFDHANRKATVLGSGEQGISYISLSDVAQFAAACVDNPRARNRVIELGGPEPITPLAVVKVFERAAGAPYEVQYIPAEALEAQYAAADHPVQKTFAGLMLSLSRGDEIPMDATAAEFNIKLKSAEDLAPMFVAQSTAANS